MPLRASRFLALSAAVALAGQADAGGAPTKRLPPRISTPPQLEIEEQPADRPAGAPEGAGPRGTSQRDGEGQRYDAVGYASWYGDEMGRGRTASGQPFDPRAVSAAHPTLPMGSFAEVTALDSGKTILVVITDRGPNGPSRIIDLSRAAAVELGIHRAGIAAVRVRSVDPSVLDAIALREGRSAAARMDAPPLLLAALRKRLPPRGRATPQPITRAAARVAGPVPVPSAYIPTGAEWFVQVLATSSRDKAEGIARSLGGSVVPAGAVYRVRIGPFAVVDDAERARDGAARRGYGDARVLRD